MHLAILFSHATRLGLTLYLIQPALLLRSTQPAFTGTWYIQRAERSGMSADLSLLGCPVSKAVVLASLASSLYQQHVSSLDHHVWGLHGSLKLLAFRSAGEIALGGLLLYQARVFERQKGSSRYGAKVLLVLTMDQLVHMILRICTSLSVSASPFSLLAANLISNCTEIPAVQEYHLPGLRLSNKVLLYAANAYLFVSALRHSPMSLAVGATVGFAYHANVLGVRRLQVPVAFSSVCNRIFGWALGQQTKEAQIMGPARHGRQPANHGLVANNFQISEESLVQLLSMGFDEEQARHALQETDNNVNAALSRLL